MSQRRHMPQFESVIDDTVQCLLFFPSLSDSDRTLWEQRCSDLNNIIEKIAENYIWHRDKFRLYLPLCGNKHGFPPHLASSTCFGDNIEDEWFIVYIVLELTKKYDDLIVQVRDNDGEFLLIETANCLPSWANPENTDNRVFIANNHIHMIEPDAVNLDTTFGLHDAIKMVSNKETFVSPVIDQAVQSRIGNYPEKIKNNLHKAIVNIPVSIASLLFLKPSLIAPIVCAYCDHDVIDAKALQNISFENCVTVEVTFTKFLYAMLAHSNLLKCNNKFKWESEKDKKNIIGFKLACGFQIILNSTSDIFSTKEYHKFISSLKENGYFKDNIEGSKEYTTLLEKAKNFFTNIECPMNLHISNQISEIMSSNEFAQQLERIRINSLSSVELCEDNEDWMSIQPDHLNDFLNMNYGTKPKFTKDEVITPQEIASKLTNFLTESSDFEGIETYDENDNDNKQIDFDANEFSNCLEKMMNLLTSKTETIDHNSENSDVDEMDDDLYESDNNYDNEMDVELKMKLNSNHMNDLCTTNSVSQNILQSIREEQASSGPSSNLLQAVGINKNDVLDSDDDNN